jgi:hypothetical protein
MNIFSSITGQEQIICQWDEHGIWFVLYQHALLDFYSANLLKQQSAGRHVDLFWHIYSDSETTSVYYLSFMLCRLHL